MVRMQAFNGLQWNPMESNGIQWSNDERRMVSEWSVVGQWSNDERRKVSEWSTLIEWRTEMTVAAGTAI